MMEKEKLRKADVFSGAFIFCFGLWVISQAVKMPMKGSWGGVLNVWFVSPALFPLFVGAMIALLGALLVHTALKTVGFAAIGAVMGWMASRELLLFLRTPALIRFYAMLALFFSFVFLNISRIDFFLGAVLFLLVFISMFYFDDDRLLIHLLLFFLAGSLVTLIFFAVGMPAALEPVVPYAADWLTLVFIVAYGIFTWTRIHTQPLLRKKYATLLVLAVLAPFLIGSAFKYLLLVPMPKEGLVVLLLDAIRYWEF